MSYTKPDAGNILRLIHGHSQQAQKISEVRPCGFCDMWADRQTDMLITILCTPLAWKATIKACGSLTADDDVTSIRQRQLTGAHGRNVTAAQRTAAVPRHLPSIATLHRLCTHTPSHLNRLISKQLPYQLQRNTYSYLSLLPSDEQPILCESYYWITIIISYLNLRWSDANWHNICRNQIIHAFYTWTSIPILSWTPQFPNFSGQCIVS